jgi:NADPH2:quinone reductase
MSRVVVATAFGGPEVLAVVDEDLGAPGPGEVALEVRAAGVNPADFKAYRGDWGRDPAKLPMRLGFEAAGVVTAVGADAIGPAGPVAVGDEVIAYRIKGGYADRLVVPAESVVPKPSVMSWPEAGGLMLTGATAVHVLTAGNVSRGETVLVHAAAGGVGVMVVQLAVARGARVIGTANARNHDLLRELGAEPVAYGGGLADRVRLLAPDGIDAALDLVGTDEAMDVSLELVADRQRVVTIANFDRGPSEGVRLLGAGPGADPGDEVRDAARLELVEHVSAGRLRVIVDRTYPLADAAAAHQALAARSGRGKLVLVP